MKYDSRVLTYQRLKEIKVDFVFYGSCSNLVYFIIDLLDITCIPNVPTQRVLQDMLRMLRIHSIVKESLRKYSCALFLESYDDFPNSFFCHYSREGKAL